MAQTETTAKELRAPSRSDRDWLLLAAILLLALLLRAYRLSAQSAWIDDFEIARVINAPSLSAYLDLMRLRAKDLLPLYYCAIYCFNALLGGCSATVLRFPNLACNLASIALLFTLTRSLFGRKAALLAALCMALSPTQIFCAQSIALHGSLVLLALLSMTAFTQALRTARFRWWLAFALANLCLVWTHAFAVFFVAVECTYLLWRLRHRLRELIPVAGVHILIGLSPLLFFYQTLTDVAKPEEDFAYQLPPIKTLLADWVADDAVMTVDPFSFQGQTWPWLPQRVQQALIDAHVSIDWIMIAFLGGCIAWGLYAIFRRPDPEAEAFNARDGAALMAVAGLIPLIVHLILSLVWRPILLQRFTICSTPAVYALIGAGIVSIADAGLRKRAVAFLLCIYAYQLSLALPATQRTDYLGAARQIAASAKPEDTVLVAGTFVSWDAFRFNAGPTPYTILPAFSLKAVADKAALLLSKEAPASLTAWAVIDPFVFTLPPLNQFEERLAALGLEWARTDLPGMNKVFVYRINAGKTRVPAPAFPDMTVQTDYAAMLADLGCNPDDHSARGMLQDTWDVQFVRTTWFYSLLAEQLAGEGYLDLAKRAADHSVALDGKAPLSQFARAVVLGEQGDAEGSRQAFAEARKLDLVGYIPIYEPFFKALYWDKDLTKAREELKNLDGFHAPLPYACYVTAGVLPRVSR